MDRASLEIVQKTLVDSRDVVNVTLRDDHLQSTIVKIANKWIESLRAGGKIVLCGNGGSAGDAQHIAGELVSRFLFDRAPLAGLALTVDTSVLTAIGNDYGYEHTFSRQVRALGRAGDVLVGISTSGRSPNVVAALRAAREIGMVTIGFTGNGNGQMSEHCDLVFRAPSASTPLIQQIHITIGHIVCQIVEQAMFGARGDEA
jgi:D-sedoheptulose 7-phosphate isomerase